MRTFGSIVLKNGSFLITAEPHVMIRVKSVFPAIAKHEYGTVQLMCRPEICRDMEWFIQRYPLKLEESAASVIREGSKHYQKTLEELEQINLPEFSPRAFEKMTFPPRRYQAQAVEVYLRTGHLLIADQMGLGKTVCAITSFTNPETIPALVVCQTHLALQWKNDFLKKFLPSARVHIIKKAKPYDLPEAEVYIITYSKLTGWAEVFRKPFLKSIVFDEVQELRRSESGKYSAAEAIREACRFCLGLSGTPIYNYGDEIFNVMDVIAPNKLGTWGEFSREWCRAYGDKWLLSDPPAFGSYLRENFLMMRRTRADVGLELPAVQRIVQSIPYDLQVMDKIKNTATELAHLILHGSFTESGQAAREFDLKLRQTTGIAKAPFVAEFVKMLVEDGQQVLLFGWHREVYSVWLHHLSDLNPVLYTGTESPAAKERSKQEFISGRSKVMIMSLRSGSGVDGLQEVCSTAVYGELDWSPGVHEQCEARLNRDGVGRGVTSFFLVADGGSDPPMAEVLGLKSSQVEGLLASQGEQKRDFTQADTERIKKMASSYLGRKTNTNDELQTKTQSLVVSDEVSEPTEETAGTPV